jgi:riboflavin synthase
MFTGIVEELGEVVDLETSGPAGDAALLTVRGPLVAPGARHGESIAVNGVCLTVVAPDGARREPDTVTADVMAETLKRTTLGSLLPGERVNLERARAIGDRLGGHMVQGHVDGTGVILGRAAAERWTDVRIGMPPNLARYVAEKGSITVDGVSLTVVTAGFEEFTVSLIPTTLAETTLGLRQVGDAVNLEVDVIAKYVERLAAFDQGRARI